MKRSSQKSSNHKVNQIVLINCIVLQLLIILGYTDGGVSNSLPSIKMLLITVCGILSLGIDFIVYRRDPEDVYLRQIYFDGFFIQLKMLLTR